MVAPRVGHEGRVIGVDVSEMALALAREKAKNFGFTQCEFRVGEISSLDFRDEEFDLVISSFASFGEPTQLLSELYRVLKPGGALLWQEWTPTDAAPEAAYDELFQGYRVREPDEKLIEVREAVQREIQNWQSVATPADSERLARDAGFAQTNAHLETIATHFQNAGEYVEWRSLYPTYRAELDAMRPEKRAQFERAAVEALHPFETAKGFDIDWSAIQLVAKK